MRMNLSERWTALTERMDGVGDWLAPWAELVGTVALLLALDRLLLT